MRYLFAVIGYFISLKVDKIGLSSSHYIYILIIGDREFSLQVLIINELSLFTGD